MHKISLLKYQTHPKQQQNITIVKKVSSVDQTTFIITQSYVWVSLGNEQEMVVSKHWKFKPCKSWL